MDMTPAEHRANPVGEALLAEEAASRVYVALLRRMQRMEELGFDARVMEFLVGMSQDCLAPDPEEE
jgi:hypothetical protein